jgi:hypothetical protein
VLVGNPEAFREDLVEFDLPVVEVDLDESR